MFTLETENDKFDVEVTFETALIYEAEFHSDILKDLFGRQDENSSAIEMDFDSESGDGNDDAYAHIVAIDFTKVSWSSVMKALWAAARTANALVPGYSIWVKTIKGVNLWDVRDMLMEEARDCFFRAPAATEEVEQQSQD